MWRAALLLVCCLIAASPATAQIDSQPKVTARLVPESTEVAPGQTITVALEEKIRPGWHTYWVNPGDAGAPTAIQWTLPPGWHAGQIRWPYPSQLPVGPLMNYGYEGDPWFLVDLSVPQDARAGDKAILKAAATWLVCKDVCVPEEAALSSLLRIVVRPQAPDAATAREFERARSQLPAASPWAARYARGTGALKLFLAAPALAISKPASALFFPFDGHALKMSAPETLSAVAGGIALNLVPSKRFRTGAELAGVLVLRSLDGSVRALNIRAREGAVPQAISMNETGLTIGLALLFAFAGGLILNLMPCVLPVLAMKAVALVRHSVAERNAMRKEAVYYAAGVVIAFAGLGLLLYALRTSGATIGWGFQLQEPIVVAGLSLLMFAVGLNLSGVYEVNPVSAGDSLTRRSGAAGAFFTGLLAVSVAAPCTAPFMAAAIAFALTQSSAIVLLTFLALGIGFALPMLLLALFPGSSRIVPAAGGWMITLRQALAFPMYGAVAWLIWVLAQQVDSPALAAALASLLFFAFSMWLWSTTRGLATRRGRAMGTLATLMGLIVCFSFLATLRQSGQPRISASASLSSGIQSQPYSAARLAALRSAGRPVFVDATAAWCITCLVNDDAVFARPETRSAFLSHHVAFLVADWTNRNPEISRLIEANGRSGVPLYLYYRAGAASPEILPQILTPGTIVRTLKRD
ncbi:MAG: thioredoxin family protein [Alphaproteobacteria bacterium]|nr:thioredoxin family protein [Alphaproteobacteria bacterium]